MRRLEGGCRGSPCFLDLDTEIAAVFLLVSRTQPTQRGFPKKRQTHNGFGSLGLVENAVEGDLRRFYGWVEEGLGLALDLA